MSASPGPSRPTPWRKPPIAAATASPISPISGFARRRAQGWQARSSQVNRSSLDAFSALRGEETAQPDREESDDAERDERAGRAHERDDEAHAELAPYLIEDRHDRPSA